MITGNMIEYNTDFITLSKQTGKIASYKGNYSQKTDINMPVIKYNDL